MILSWYFDIFKSTLRFWYDRDNLILSWTVGYQNMKPTLRFWYYHDILILSWYFDIIMIFYWYYQMVFDISFINHIMVIFWYYHDILIFKNKAMMVAEYQNIKSTVRFWEFDIIMIFWYFQINFDTSLVCHLAVIFCYCHDILRFKIKTIIITNVCCLVL